MNERCKIVVDQAKIHYMVGSKDWEERKKAADELNNNFVNLLHKKQAWDELIRLKADTDSNVRASAYHSMGKISVFKAANSENDIGLKKYLELAIGFFEQSSQQGAWSEPAKFCLPFYICKHIFIGTSLLQNAK